MDYERNFSRSTEKVFQKETSEREEKTEYTTYILPQVIDFSSEEEIFIDTGYMLKIISGSENGRKFILDRPLISIGKYTGTDRKGWILLNSSSISGEQATLKWMKREKRYGIIHTADAITPTFVNEREVSSWEFTMLERGDIILAGTVRIIVCKIRAFVKSCVKFFQVPSTPSIKLLFSNLSYPVP